MPHLQKRQMPKIQKCILERREKPKMVRLSLQSFTSAFVILAIGIGIAVVTFLVEIIIKKYQMYNEP
jgi:multisubunit Na+/H+ antiporter MnhC subunit